MASFHHHLVTKDPICLPGFYSRSFLLPVVKKLPLYFFSGRTLRNNTGTRIDETTREKSHRSSLIKKHHCQTIRPDKSGYLLQLANLFKTAQ